MWHSVKILTFNFSIPIQQCFLLNHCHHSQENFYSKIKRNLSLIIFEHKKTQRHSHCCISRGPYTELTHSSLKLNFGAFPIIDFSFPPRFGGKYNLDGLDVIEFHAGRDFIKLQWNCSGWKNYTNWMTR